MNICAVETWLAVGIICIIIEFSQIPGIGFFFLGLGALTTSALISSYLEISDYQIATFGLISLTWFLVLWWPLKKFVNGKRTGNNINQGYFNLVGQYVRVLNRNIEPSKIGQVSWSGTIMNARLVDSENEHVNPDSLLYVLEVQGNVLICSRKKP